MNDLPINDLYLMVPIVALLPLSSLMLVLQVSPYQALVIRGIVGAIAALVYALLGAADVALTEALVGTMLSITLYAIAVRSSMSIKVGVREADEAIFSKTNGHKDLVPSPIAEIRELCTQHHMRLEPVYYVDASDLKQALSAKEVHAILSPQSDECSNGCSNPGELSDRTPLFYQFQTRVPRLYEILDAQFEHPELLLAELNETNGDLAPKQNSNSANRKTVSKVG
ncbi:MAG: DUF4040 domain-containing protein [Cyanobacteria bacterium P01_A01_bin.3]